MAGSSDVGSLQEDETVPRRAVFSVAKTVRGKLAVIAVMILVPSLLSIGLNSSSDERSARDAEVISLMSNYSVDNASIYDGSWTGNDGSLPGRYSLDITKDGAVHRCRQVRVESLRASEPIKCDDGTVIHAKVDQSSPR